MNIFIFILIFLFSSLAHAGQNWSIAPRLDLMIFCESSDNKSVKDLELVLERVRSENDFIYVQILFQNANYETRHNMLLLLAERPLKERQMAFKAAIAWNNIWNPDKRNRRRFEVHEKFVNEAVDFARNAEIKINGVDLLNLDQRRNLMLQLEQSDGPVLSKHQTEKKFNTEDHHFTKEVPASLEKPLPSSSLLIWAVFGTVCLVFGMLLVKKLRPKL